MLWTSRTISYRARFGCLVSVSLTNLLNHDLYRLHPLATIGHPEGCDRIAKIDIRARDFPRRQQSRSCFPSSSECAVCSTLPSMVLRVASALNAGMLAERR